FVPPRYRRRVSAGPRQEGVVTEGEAGAEGTEPPARVTVGVSGANGATAVGERSRFGGRGGGEREKATSTRS
ncbi:undecaprenyl-phosphate alpha-N-acetylglucosaminyl 1-phosphate transferase, partial [Streptomyces albidoflavus]